MSLMAFTVPLVYLQIFSSIYLSVTLLVTQILTSYQMYLELLTTFIKLQIFQLSTESVVHLIHYISEIWLQGCYASLSKISRCLCCFHLIQQDRCLIRASSEVGLIKSILDVPSHPLVCHMPGHCFQEGFAP